MQTFYTQQDYNIYIYKNQLKRDSNKAGLVLILFFLVMTVISTGAVFIPLLGNLFSSGDTNALMEMEFLNDTTFLMLMSGFVSIVTFFGVSILYTLFTKSSLGKTYPLEKIGFKLTYHLCAIGLAVCMIANYVSNILLALFDSVGLEAITESEYNCDSVLDIVLFYATVAVLPALIEEFAFRGVILNIFRKYSDGLAVLVSGVTFGLMHGNFAQIPFALVVGLVLGYIAVKTNSLLPGIIIHFLNNALSVTFTLLSTNTDLSDSAVNLIYSIVLIQICILGLISFTVLSKKHSGFFKLLGADTSIEFKEKAKIAFYSPTVLVFSVISIMEAIMMVVMAEVPTI